MSSQVLRVAAGAAGVPHGHRVHLGLEARRGHLRQEHHRRRGHSRRKGGLLAEGHYRTPQRQKDKVSGNASQDRKSVGRRKIGAAFGFNAALVAQNHREVDGDAPRAISGRRFQTDRRIASGSLARTRNLPLVPRRPPAAPPSPAAARREGSATSRPPAAAAPVLRTASPSHSGRSRTQTTSVDREPARRRRPAPARPEPEHVAGQADRLRRRSGRRRRGRARAPSGRRTRPRPPRPPGQGAGSSQRPAATAGGASDSERNDREEPHGREG